MSARNPVLQKLDEVKYFLERMQELKTAHQEFSYNLNAFLCAARSVSYVLWWHYKPNRREAFDAWWAQQELPDHPVHGFFTKARDATVHKRSLDLLHEEEARLVQIEDGTYTVRASTSGPGASRFLATVRLRYLMSGVPGEFEITAEYHWEFEDFPKQIGYKNNVLELARFYAEKLEQLVTDAVDEFGS